MAAENANRDELHSAQLPRENDGPICSTARYHRYCPHLPGLLAVAGLSTPVIVQLRSAHRCHRHYVSRFVHAGSAGRRTASTGTGRREKKKCGLVLEDSEGTSRNFGIQHNSSLLVLASVSPSRRAAAGRLARAARVCVIALHAEGRLARRATGSTHRDGRHRVSKIEVAATVVGELVIRYKSSICSLVTGTGR
jgi:hypothetical protein